MIGSQGINNLSRAAGDESLQHLQRVNKDGHEEQKKGGSGRGDKKPDNEKGQTSDSYERTAEDINTKPPTPIPFPPATSRQHLSDVRLPQQANTPASDSPKDSGAGDVSDSDIKNRKKSGPPNDGTKDDDAGHIDLVG